MLAVLISRSGDGCFPAIYSLLTEVYKVTFENVYAR